MNQSSGDISAQLQFPENEGGDAGFVFQVCHPGGGADNFTGYEVSLSPAGYLVLGRHIQKYQSLSRVPCSVPTSPREDLLNHFQGGMQLGDMWLVGNEGQLLVVVRQAAGVHRAGRDWRQRCVAPATADRWLAGH
ncbi:MAG TPA: hypothetical protein VNX46_11400 [Candidatus Acidoferrum sp.]|nr:hypothetical protein [Candidatus Acidoferrum sp.]